MSQTDPKIRMLRKLVWIEEKRFRGFGCSECAWVFNASGSPTGNSFDEMTRNFESQRDAEFSSHVSARITQGTPAPKAEADSGEALQWERPIPTFAFMVRLLFMALTWLIVEFCLN